MWESSRRWPNYVSPCHPVVDPQMKFLALGFSVGKPQSYGHMGKWTREMEASLSLFSISLSIDYFLKIIQNVYYNTTVRGFEFGRGHPNKRYLFIPFFYECFRSPEFCPVLLRLTGWGEATEQTSIKPHQEQMFGAMMLRETPVSHVELPGFESCFCPRVPREAAAGAGFSSWVSGACVVFFILA